MMMTWLILQLILQVVCGTICPRNFFVRIFQFELMRQNAFDMIVRPWWFQIFIIRFFLYLFIFQCKNLNYFDWNHSYMYYICSCECHFFSFQLQTLSLISNMDVTLLVSSNCLSVFFSFRHTARCLLHKCSLWLHSDMK